MIALCRLLLCSEFHQLDPMKLWLRQAQSKVCYDRITYDMYMYNLTYDWLIDLSENIRLCVLFEFFDIHDIFYL